jgi:hypothetical protein
VTKHITAAVVLLLASGAFVAAQTKPAQAEIDQWNKDANAQMLETSPCTKVIWLLENERNTSPAELPKQPIRYALGWWGRGFIEGAVYMIPGDKAQEAASRFGVSVEVVASHIAAYCYDHHTATPLDAIQALLLTVLKTVEDK